MADVMPDYHLEQQRLIAQIASLKSNVEQQKLEIMQIESRREKLVENIEATKKSVGDLEKDLRGLVETHGEAASAEQKG